MAFSKEYLIELLTYDSEEKRFLSLENRCLIHKEITRQLNGKKPSDFKDELQKLLIIQSVEIKESRWVCPEIRYIEENGIIKKRILNDRNKKIIYKK